MPQASKASRSDAADGQAAQVSPADEELLAAFVGGRTAALGELARRYETPLLGLACGVLGGQRDLACDAVQETWVRVLRFAGKFRRESSFKTWVYRIAINQCRTMSPRAGAAEADHVDWAAAEDGQRVGWSEAKREDRDAGSPSSASAQPTPTARLTADVSAAAQSVSAAPAQQAIDREIQDLLRRAVAELDADRRDVVLLCYHAGMTHPEAAEILEIPVGTLKTRLHAALAALRERLGQYQQT